MNILLNKGGAGFSLSRQETAERLNELIRRHYALNHSYAYAIENHQDRELTSRLAESQKIARADIGKLAESVFSAGGSAYNGTDLEPGGFTLGSDPAKVLKNLLDLEQEFQKQVAAEFKLKHQIRTQAILLNVRNHSQERLKILENNVKSSRRAKAS
jgi:hypothetical protein